MCGFVGYASTRTTCQRDWLSIASESISYRGPDHSSTWFSDNSNVGLAHRRLAIIDLSPRSCQPLVSHDKGLVLVFNGEIYNYKDLRHRLQSAGYNFLTSGDSEVLLFSYQHWGADCMKYLNGMFSFAIFDRHKNTIFLSRDRSGEKPLFYYIADQTIYFGSELKTLLLLPSIRKTISWSSLDHYLAYGYVPGAQCMISGINKLPPAHTLTFSVSTGLFSLSRYWFPPVFSSNASNTSPLSLVDELESCLQASVSRQLQSDVPLSILLSGGLDSSLITALASRSSSTVHTFTVTQPLSDTLNESEHASLVSSYFGTKHTEIPIKDSPFSTLASTISQHLDEPIADSSLFPTFILSELVSRNSTVALGGDGGDELFGGYSHYRDHLQWRKAAKLLSLLHAQGSIASFADTLPFGIKGKNLLQTIASYDANSLPLHPNYFDLKSRIKLLSHHHNYIPIAERTKLANINPFDDPIQRSTRYDYSYYLPDNILVKTDRMSMFHSLELRSPFLDTQVLDFAFGKVPSSLKSTKNSSKILLKLLAKKILPPSFIVERKQGFSIPLAQWLKEDSSKALLSDVLLDSSSPFNHDYILTLLSRLESGYTLADRLVSLLIFELWRHHYDVKIE